MITLLRDRDGFYWEFYKYGEDRRAPVDGLWISEERAEINGIELPDGYNEGLTELLKRYGPADIMQAVSRCFWNYHTDDEGFSIDVDNWREFHFPDLNGNDIRAFRDGELIRPERLEEPTELGTVVVDSIGNKYFLVDAKHTPWVSTGTLYVSWDEIDSPVVL